MAHGPKRSQVGPPASSSPLPRDGERRELIGIGYKIWDMYETRVSPIGMSIRVRVRVRVSVRLGWGDGRLGVERIWVLI